jgi:hypothetical protein
MNINMRLRVLSVKPTQRCAAMTCEVFAHDSAVFAHESATLQLRSVQRRIFTTGVVLVKDSSCSHPLTYACSMKCTSVSAYS